MLKNTQRKAEKQAKSNCLVGLSQSQRRRFKASRKLAAK